MSTAETNEALSVRVGLLDVNDRQQQRSTADDQAVQPLPAASDHQQQQQQMLPGFTPQQLAKLRLDLEVVQKNVTVFSEMLAEQSSAADNADDFSGRPPVHREDVELLQALAQTNRQMQARLVDLIGYVGGGGGCHPLLEELLRLNDLLNDSLTRFDRLQRLLGDGGGTFNPMFDLMTEAPAAAVPLPIQLQPPPPPARLQQPQQLPQQKPPPPENPGGLPDSERELAEMEAWMSKGGGGLFPASAEGK